MWRKFEFPTYEEKGYEGGTYKLSALLVTDLMSAARDLKDFLFQVDVEGDELRLRYPDGSEFRAVYRYEDNFNGVETTDRVRVGDLVLADQHDLGGTVIYRGISAIMSLNGRPAL